MSATRIEGARQAADSRLRRMSAVPARSSRGLWVLAAVLLAGVAVAVMLPSMSASAARYLVIVPLGAALLFALFRLPAHVLPALAFVLYAVGAAQLIPSGLPVGTPSVLLLVWMVRRAAGALGTTRASRARVLAPADRLPAERAGMAVPTLSVLLLVWLLLLIELGDLGGNSTGWLLNFVPVVLAPLLVRDLSREAAVLERSWIVLATILGIYALIEFNVRANFLYWAVGFESSQHWSVYRPEGPFGHPLLFGTFLAVGALLAFGKWLEGHRGANLVAASVAVAGVVVTSSRGSLIAVVAGILVVVAVVVARPGRSRRGRAWGLVLLLAAAAAVLIPATPLLDRWMSDEADGSSTARSQGFEVAMSLAERSSYLGTGAGTSSLASTLAGSTLPIELSPLQALVSLGVPGVALLLAIIFVGISRALAARHIAAVGGLTAFLVAISGYNYFDDRRSALILFGMILVIAVGSERRATSDLSGTSIEMRPSK